jgi:hypothetical protein
MWGITLKDSLLRKFPPKLLQETRVFNFESDQLKAAIFPESRVDVQMSQS